MNTLKLSQNPGPAAVDRGSMTQCGHRFRDDAGVTAGRLQAVARGIAHPPHRGCFAHKPGFEGIESEACHG